MFVGERIVDQQPTGSEDTRYLASCMFRPYGLGFSGLGFRGVRFRV